MKKIDVPGPAGSEGAGAADVPGRRPARRPTSADLLQQMYQSSTIIRIRPIGTDKIMVYAPPADLMDIAGIIEGNHGAPASTSSSCCRSTRWTRPTRPDTLRNMFPQDPKTLVGPVVEADTTRNAVRAKGSQGAGRRHRDGPEGDRRPRRRRSQFDGHQPGARQRRPDGDHPAEGAGGPRAPGQGRSCPGPPPEGRPRCRQRRGQHADGPRATAGRPGSGNGGGDTPTGAGPQPADNQPPANPNAKPVTITAIGNKLIINTDDPQTRQFIQEVVRTMTQSGGDGDFEVIKLE